MSMAKSKSPNSSAFYDHSLSSEVEHRLLLETELKKAVSDMHQFELLYQPQFNQAKECIGAEALIRWNNPERGMVPPDLFIPIAEETGLMLDIGDWMISQACAHINKLESLQPPPTFSKLAINVSAVQITQDQFVDRLNGIVKKTAVKPELLGVELTESSIIANVAEAVQKMKRLTECGIGFSIDDFGTGYSSLAYLTKFPIDTLKIDRAFIRNIHLDSGNRAIVNAIIALGQSLGIDLIAEGVETGDELNCLSEAGCHHYQGYYFERPMPFDDVCRILTKEGDS